MTIELYPQIIQAFKRSEAGQSLSKIYRWSKFRGSSSEKRWKELLGASANDFSHGLLFYGIGKEFLKKETGRFSPEEQRTFLNGLICHDWGEAIIDGSSVGDVSAQVKNNRHEEEESKVVRKVLTSLDIDNQVKSELLNGYQEVVEGKNPKLHNAFKALEKTEYVLNAIKMYRNSTKRRGLNRNNLATPLVARVLVIDMSKIIDKYIPEYPNSIGKMFWENRALIDEMYQSTKPWLETTSEWLGEKIDHKALGEDFFRKWSDFKVDFQTERR
ncbi:MAG TPA: hypothetical protein VF189_03800 [Patescibacteria group bacterium]